MLTNANILLTFHNLKNLNKSQYIIIKNNGKYRTENLLKLVIKTYINLHYYKNVGKCECKSLR